MRGNSRFLWVALSVCLALTTAVSAQTLEEKVQEFELDNGMKFLVVERHEAPVVFGAVAFKVGSIYERPGITGISHLLEHMLFKGTETVGTKDYKKERPFLEREDELAEAARNLRYELEAWRLEFFDECSSGIVSGFSEEDREVTGADRALELELLIERMTESGPTSEMLDVYSLVEFEGVDYYERYLELKRLEMDLYDTIAEHRELIISNEFWETYVNNGSRMLNAGTSYDATFYFAYIPANRLELWMLLESDRMMNSTFREFYSEKDVVMEERRMSENEPEDALDEAFMATAYTACMYGSPVLGWMTDIEDITRQDLIDYYNTYYGAQNAIGVVVGDVDFEEVKAMAKKYFGKVDAGEPLPHITDVEPKQQGERRLVVRKDAKPTLTIGYHMPKAPHPDYYALEILSSILAQGRTSRFYRSIFEDQGLTRRAPDAGIGPGFRLDPIFQIYADPKEPHTLEEIEAAIYVELDRVKVEGVTAREIERVWNRTDAELVRALGSNMGVAFRIGFYGALRGDWRELQRDVERSKKVTPSDIRRVANTYFGEENRTVGWLVETESEDGEGGPEFDMRELMGWAMMNLSEGEQQELMMQFQQASEPERQAIATRLWERMKASQGESTGEETSDGEGSLSKS
ncbi:insulinase family protein [bacterium]|nr:insulinase family protein [bacterium]